MSDHSLEYLAGFFDGEGSITMSQNKTQTWPVVSVNLGQIDPTILLEFKRRWGGTMTFNACTNTTSRPYWRWAAQARKAEACLRALEPHLVGKHPETVAALLVRDNMRLRGNNKSRLTTEEQAARRSVLDNFNAVRYDARTAIFPPSEEITT